MKAAIFHAPGEPLTIEDVLVRKPERNEVLVRTRAAGLCHSDLSFLNGKFSAPPPAVLGHEAAGVVEAVGDGVTYVKPGDHVVTCLSVFCGHCEFCATGHPSICSNTDVKMPPGVARRLSWKGTNVSQCFNISAFAEQMLVHENAIVRVQPDMPFTLAAMLGCGVLTGYGAVAHTARIEAGSTVAVIGCGGVGLSAIHAARLAGAARIYAVDNNADKLALARVFGATDTVVAAGDDVASRIVEATGGGVHHAIECVGLKTTAELAFEILRPRGTATIVGLIAPGIKLELKGFEFLRERRVQGSVMGSNHFRIDIPRLIDFHMQGRMQLEQLVSKRIRLDQINEGFAELEQGRLARCVIEFDT